jgi:putative transcriptional regulator
MKHPTQDQIEQYALGRADWTARVLMEAHLAFCPECEKHVQEIRRKEYQNSDIEHEAISPAYSNDLLKDLVREMETPVGSLVSPPASEIEKCLPESVRAELPPESEWQWRSMWPTKGRIAAIQEDPTTGVSLYCAEFKAGETAPAHEHLVQEDTVMLKGGYTYGDNVVRVGDWDTATPETDHAPTVDLEEDCVCLVRIQTHDSYRFKGSSLWRQPFVSLSSWLARA